MRGIFLLLVGVAASVTNAAALNDSFADNPLHHGWKIFGDTNLFRWNATNENIDVTWDSSKPNSYFHKSLANILTKTDDFSVQFDLRMQDLAVGVNPNKPYTFPLAIGFFNYRNATNTNFFRGSGANPTYGGRNIVEFAYFGDAGLGETFAPTIASSNNVFAYSHSFPLALTPGDLFQIRMEYTATNQTLQTTVLRNGQPFGMPPENRIESIVLTNKPDFRVDTIAIESYNDGQQFPAQYAGSLLAHGTVDNVLVVTPPPPVRDLRAFSSNGIWQVAFTARTNWSYVLEETEDFGAWSLVSSVTNNTNSTLTMSDTNSLAPAHRFYRVRSERP